MYEFRIMRFVEKAEPTKNPRNRIWRGLVRGVYA